MLAVIIILTISMLGALVGIIAESVRRSREGAAMFVSMRNNATVEDAQIRRHRPTVHAPRVVQRAA